MKTRIFIIFLLISISFFNSGTLHAKINVPGRTGHWVNDYAGIIDETTKKYLERRISSINQKTPDPIEIIIATFPDLGDWEPKEFAFEYGKRWGRTRQGRDNGVILLLATKEGFVDIGVGRNLSGILTDERMQVLINDTIMPSIKNGTYSEGIKKWVETIIDILGKEEIPADKPGSVGRIILIFLIIIVIFFLIKSKKQL